MALGDNASQLVEHLNNVYGALLHNSGEIDFEPTRIQSPLMVASMRNYFQGQGANNNVAIQQNIDTVLDQINTRIGELNQAVADIEQAIHSHVRRPQNINSNVGFLGNANAGWRDSNRIYDILMNNIRANRLDPVQLSFITAIGARFAGPLFSSLFDWILANIINPIVTTLGFAALTNPELGAIIAFFIGGIYGFYEYIYLPHIETPRVMNQIESAIHSVIDNEAIVRYDNVLDLITDIPTLVVNRGRTIYSFFNGQQPEYIQVINHEQNNNRNRIARILNERRILDLMIENLTTLRQEMMAQPVNVVQAAPANDAVVQQQGLRRRR
jgi:hypothetical protein